MAAEDKVTKLTAARGRDVSAPRQTITLNGERHVLVFSNAALREAEDVYEAHFGKDVGIDYILAGLAKSKYAAMQAVCYGALVAGGCDMDWKEFDEAFGLTSLDAYREALLRGVTGALPDGPGEESQKNG